MNDGGSGEDAEQLRPSASACDLSWANHRGAGKSLMEKWIAEQTQSLDIKKKKNCKTQKTHKKIQTCLLVWFEAGFRSAPTPRLSQFDLLSGVYDVSAAAAVEPRRSRNSVGRPLEEQQVKDVNNCKPHQ